MSTLLIALVLSAATGPKFIDDDYPRALKQAKAQKKLLFVDAWAPWCHTCIAMKEQVFTRAAFAAFEKDVVFASIDTERAKSDAFLKKFPVEVWPTLLFIDPVKETVVLKWLGSADETQMQALLEAARGGPGVVRDADDALGAGNAGVAAEKYQKAVEAGEVKARTVLSMLSAMSLAKQHDACARTTMEQLPLFTNAQERVAAITWGLGCAVDLPEGKQKSAILDTLVREATKALPLEGVLPDDMSGLYEVLVAEREAAKDDAATQKLAGDWLAFLEAQAAKAATPAARAVFDPHRVSAALGSKQAEKMVEPLLLSEKEFPKDYNPPARLAVIYRELGKFDEGLKAIERALSKCKEGPRKLRLFDTKASLQDKKGDAAGKRKTIEEAVKYAKKLPKTQVSEKRIAALEAQLK
ncbi:MAG: thioredoxin family protein [Archangium sp.]|nr:thioredoxin family protein [Archangium sp.]MDP3153732.1 thioredoxin family protein [Archangium sp.]MDP3569219.1 thioredoxin family protein [Archangium sp.]